MSLYCWGDLFIWLLPSKLACPCDRWQLCPRGHRALTFSRSVWLEGQLRREDSYFMLHFIFPPSFSHHVSFIALEPQILPIFAAVWMQMGLVTFCRFNVGKSPAFCVTHAVVQRWKAWTPRVEPELVPCQISHLYPRVVRPTVPLNRTTDARGGQRTELSREQFVCKWRDLADDRVATQRFLQLALWKMRNRDTIYPRCVASQCLCSCNAS